MKKYIYLAWSIAKWESKTELDSWREIISKILNDKIKDTISIIPFDPGKWLDFSMPIYARYWRCVEMIYKSDAIIVWANEKIWIWTAQEMDIARYYNKLVISICAENTHYNKIIKGTMWEDIKYLHPFISASSDLVVNSEEEAIEAFIWHITWKTIIEKKTIDNIENLRQDYLENYFDEDEYFKNLTKN